MIRIFLLSALFFGMLFLHMQVMVQSWINPNSASINLVYFLTGIFCFATGLAVLRIILGEIAQFRKTHRQKNPPSIIENVMARFSSAKELELFGPNRKDA